VRTLRSFVSFVLLCGPVAASAEVNPAWTTSIAPFKIADNLYYVGSQDLASYLVVTPKGNILINADLVSSPPQIRASIEKLGFRWQDTRVLVNSQAHDDHMGGAAEVIRETHAKNMVMDGDVSVVETGAKTDFLAPSPNIPGYPSANVGRGRSLLRAAFKEDLTQGERCENKRDCRLQQSSFLRGRGLKPAQARMYF
jgi:metallo-beta-lactamase class B